MNSIFTRRSVRQFTDEVVSQEKIEKILRAGMQAPSSWNQQPWEFIVVEGRENLDNLSALNVYASSLKTATLAIVISGDTNKMRAPEKWQQDLGAATQNILLQATELGLGSVWYGVAPNKETMDFVTEMFNLEENIHPYSIVGIGYPKDPNANKFIDRFDASRVRYIK